MKERVPYITQMVFTIIQNDEFCPPETKRVTWLPIPKIASEVIAIAMAFWILYIFTIVNSSQ